MVLWVKRLVCRGEICGFVVFVGINAEHAKVAGMTGPTPVVGLTTKFSYTFWRGSNQTNVAVYFVVHRQVLISVIERGDFHHIVVAFFTQSGDGCFFGFGDLGHYGFGAGSFVLVDGDII